MDVRRITLPDLWRFRARQKSPIARRNYAEVIAEAVAGQVWGAFDAQGPVAIGGVADGLEGGPGIVWLSVLPGAMAGRGVAMVRAMRAIVAAEAGRFARGAVAMIDCGNGNGQRLALIVGLLPSDRVVIGLREWRSGRIDGQITAQAGASRGSGSG